MRAGRGHGLRRAALSVTPSGSDGWDVVELTYADVGRLADQVLPYADDVVVEEPAEAVDAVLRRLRVLAGSDA